MPKLREGQIWADNDPRIQGRKIEIISLPTPGGGRTKVKVKNTKTGRITFVDPKRFKPTSTGYVLIQESYAYKLEAEEKFLKARYSLRETLAGEHARLNSDYETVSISLEAYVELSKDAIYVN